MKKALENLWNRYLSEECSVIDTDEERSLAKIAVELHERADALMNDEQKRAVEKYVEALSDIDAIFVKKAFCRGCEFAVSFLLESGNF